jgi:hypothetical protein
MAMPSIFDIGLEEDARPMAGQDSISHAKATISDDNLPLPMNGLRHHHHYLCSRLHVVVLCWECPRPTLGLLWSILTFNQLDSPKDWLAAIPVGNGVILIAEQVRLMGDTHEPRAKLREPQVHRLVEATKPCRVVLTSHVVVPCINQLPDVVEAINKSALG